MRKNRKILATALLLILALSVGLTGCAKSQPSTQPEPAQQQEEVKNDKFAGYAHPESLITVDELKKIMNGENIAIVDVRDSAKYLLGHIPGAVQTFREDYSDNSEIEGMIGTKEQVEGLMAKLGISNDTRIVLYGDKGNYDAARLWWVLKVYGHKDMQLLDGGIDAWKAAGGETTLAKPEVKPGAYTITEFNKEWIASTEDVKAVLEDKSYVVLDTRADKEYTGEELKKGAFRKGRVPGATFIEWSKACNEDWTFKSVDDLKALYEGKDVTGDKTVYPYCQSGVRSAHTTFVLTQLLGYENVKNYDASWIGWSKDESLPLEEGMPQ